MRPDTRARNTTNVADRSLLLVRAVGSNFRFGGIKKKRTCCTRRVRRPDSFGGGVCRTLKIMVNDFDGLAIVDEA